MSEEDLEYHYEQTVKKRRKSQVYPGILTTAIMAIFASFIIIIGSIQNQRYELEFWGSLPTLIISAVVIAILKPKLKKHKVKKHYLFFVKFYEAFESLQNLKESMKKFRKELYENDIKDAKLGVEDLADHIDEWVVSTSPDALQEFPNSLSNALRKRIIPVIESTDEINFTKFYTLLKDECELLYTREPTYEEWSIFNKKLNLIGTLKEEKLRKRKISKPLFLLKPYVGAPLIWGTFTGILFYQKPEDFVIPLAIITGAAFAAATFLASEYVRNYVSKNQKQQLEEKIDVEISEWRCPENIERGKPFLVYAKISGSIKNGFLDFMFKETEDKRYWFPDPEKYNESARRGHLNLENDSYENEWKAQIPNEIKPGIYSVFMGVYEDFETGTTYNRRLLDWKEKEIKVI